MPIKREMTAEELQNFLNSCGSVKNDLKTVVLALRRKQISGSQSCAKATIEIMRSLLVQGKFHSTEQTMKIIRAVGKDLIAAAPCELIIGNLVRRILFFVREEYTNQTRLVNEATVVESPTPRSRTSSRDVTKTPITASYKVIAGSNHVTGGSRRDRSGSNLSVNSDTSVTAILPPLPPVVEIPVRQPAITRSISSNGNLSGGGDGSHVPTLETMLSQLDLDGEEDFSKQYPRLKASVLDSINELNNEIDNTAAVCQRAKDYVHNDECILTYGYSRIVELFLKAVGAKRRFQVIIAESEPSLDGHKLALALSKVANITVTLIPDSNIYALMTRVNKVIFAPHAVMADGGAICRSGHHMVAVAAKDFSVPVVGVSGAFSFTPLFAHNQSHVLDTLLAPAEVIDYGLDLNWDNIQVVNPAYDFVPPDLVDLYVTNDGSSLPSYVYRQLSEYYNPKDYDL